MKTTISQTVAGVCLFGAMAAALAAGQAAPALPAAAPVAAAPAKPAAPPAAAAPVAKTIINIPASGSTSLQIGVRVNGAYVYPFHFTMTPSNVNGITISDAGILSGTHSDSGDHDGTIAIQDDAGTAVSSYVVTLHVETVPVVMLGATASAATPSTKEQVAVNSIYAGGDTASGSVPAGGAAGGSSTGSGSSSCTGSGTTVSLVRNSEPAVTAVTGCNGAFSYQFNAAFTPTDTISVSTGSGGSAAPLTIHAQAPPKLFGEELRAIIGYEQAGASSSNFSQDWFTDFYISRPIILPFERRFVGTDRDGKSIYAASENHLRWWGNVRIASFPQAGNQTVATIATGLPAEVGKLKLNQLAQGGEFLAGLEDVFYKTPSVRGFSENTRQVFTLGFIAGFGATGFFNSPSSNVQVYMVPSPLPMSSSSPQLTAFQQYYGNVSTTYVGFIQPDNQRFQKQYLGGLRLTTRYTDPSGMPLTTAPAMLAVTLGQNEVITAGRLSGVVGRFEAFYPLPFGNRGQGVVGAFSSIYLFATAQMRLGGKSTQPPSIVLGPAPSAVNPYDANVTLIPTQNTRDVYRIGFGVDLINLISQLTGGSAKSSSGNAAPAPAAASPTAPAPSQPQN